MLEEGGDAAAATALAFLAALGTPFSWGKRRLGVRLVWIGYSIDAWLCSAVAGEAKLHIVIEFFIFINFNVYVFVFIIIVYFVFHDIGFPS